MLSDWPDGTSEHPQNEKEDRRGEAGLITSSFRSWEKPSCLLALAEPCIASWTQHPFWKGTYGLDSVAARKSSGLEPPQPWPVEMSNSKHFWKIIYPIVGTCPWSQAFQREKGSYLWLRKRGGMQDISRQEAVTPRPTFSSVIHNFTQVSSCTYTAWGRERPGRRVTIHSYLEKGQGWCQLPICQAHYTA